MKLADMHTHSKYSCDSEESIEDICLQAIDNGLKAICITDHIDYNPNDYGYNYYKSDDYFRDINIIREKYKDKIYLLRGIEFSEPHIYPEALEKYNQLDYDFILGSIHWLDHQFVGQKELLENYPQEEVEEIYYDMIIQTIKHGGFDVLAHMDFPKRYYKSSKVNSDKIRLILKLLVEKKIGLEINTSSIRKGLNESMPAISVVEEYMELGGNILTLGSDAHNVNDIASDFELVFKLLTTKAQKCLGYFVERNFIKLQQ